MIELNGITKSYISGTQKREVLRNISFKLEKGSHAAVMGPSGSGKTTFLNICGAMDFPDKGEVLFDGQLLPWNDSKKLAEYRNRNIGFIFQEHYLLNTLTALENIIVPCLVKGKSTDKDIEAARFWLNEFGLSDRTDSFPSELSGGENQRIAVARAMINNPDILLCDEPTGSLDEKTGLTLIESVVKIAKMNNTALILVSHSSQIASMMDLQFTLHNGHLVQDPGQ